LLVIPSALRSQGLNKNEFLFYCSAKKSLDSFNHFKSIVEKHLGITLSPQQPLYFYLQNIVHPLWHDMYQYHTPTAWHMVRVGVSAAQCIQFIPQELAAKNPLLLRAILLGGILHDIGKQKVKQRLLDSKRQFRTFEEFKQSGFLEHPEYGQELYRQKCNDSRSNTLSKLIEEAILKHHLHNGYPQQFKDTKISLSTALVSLADIVDAMSNRKASRHEPVEGQTIKEKIIKVLNIEWDKIVTICPEMQSLCKDKFINFLVENHLNRVNLAYAGL